MNNRPIIHVNIDEHGEIQQIHGDLRLYDPLVNKNQAPPLSTLLILTSAKHRLLPDGSIPRSNIQLDQLTVWEVEVYRKPNTQTFIRLRSDSTATQIDILLEPTANLTNLKNSDVQVHVIFELTPQCFDHLLLEVSHHADLKTCLTTFIELTDHPEYLNNTACLVRSVAELRREYHRFKMKLRQQPLIQD